jgi:hypothetical protein
MGSPGASMLESCVVGGQLSVEIDEDLLAQRANQEEAVTKDHVLSHHR